MSLRRFRPELIVLILAAFASRLWTLFTPNASAFDETYFKGFAAHYLDGQFFFDVHPPLGKLLFAGFAKMLHLSPEALLNNPAVQLRILPAIAGALLIPLTWGMLRRLGANRLFAFLGAFLVLADNALLVESRFILMDSLLLVTGLGAVYFYLVARKAAAKQRAICLLAAAVCAGMAASIKWTGLAELLLVLVAWVWDQRKQLKNLRPAHAAELAILIIIPIMLYLATFWMHFHLLRYSGPGDAFMPRQFQATLIASPYYNSSERKHFFTDFYDLNLAMYRSNKDLPDHPYGSRWYTWPIEQRPIYYWQGPTLENGTQGNVYLLGNPVIWWGIWAAIGSGIVYSVASKHRLHPTTRWTLAFVGCGYLVNYLPFAGIGRVMFLYHYFFAFIFSIMFAVLLWQDLLSAKRGISKVAKQNVLAVCIAAMVGFWYFAPLSYGTPLSEISLHQRMWLRSWH